MPSAFLMIAVAFVAYGAMARLWACNPDQRAFFTRDLADDILYWALTALVFAGTSQAMVKLALGVLAPWHVLAALAQVHAGEAPVAHWPLAIQIVAVLLVFDLIQYWAHRAFHAGALWPFHAIHHSAIDVGWSTGFRFHPVNYVLYVAAVTALIRLMGFSDRVLLAIAPFNFVMSTLVHANLDWSFGPLRYVLASPVFHRWHHVRDPAVQGRNFAPTFPVLDLIFGTFHMPRGETPRDYGADGVPTHFLAQLAYPFVALARRWAPVRKPAGEMA